VCGDGRGITHLARHILEDPSEIAEADTGVYALGHLCRLQAGGLATSRRSIVREPGRHGRPEAVPPRVLKRADVVDPAVAVVVERDGRGHALAAEARDEHMERALVDRVEQLGGQFADTGVREEVRRRDVDLSRSNSALL
jgi:hypothetical protein